MGWNIFKRRATAPLDITDRLPAGLVASGRLMIWRDGETVWLLFDSLRFTTTSQQDLLMSNVIPTGFQALLPCELPLAPRTGDIVDEARGNARTYSHVLVVYRVPAGGIVRGLVSYPTLDVMPA